MRHHLSMVSDDLTGISDEVAAHKSAQAAVGQISALAALEAEHLSKMAGLTDDMKSMCDDISETCMSGSGKMADTRSVSDFAAQMKQECANHHAAMAAAADLTAAGAEETRHQGALSDLRGKVKAGIDDMSPGADDYECSQHSH